MKKIGFALAGILFPMLALADNTTLSLSGFTGSINTLKDLVGSLIPIIMGIGVIVFFVGVIRFVLAGDDPEKRAEGRSYMIYGIVGLAVMASVWGIVKLIQGTFGVGTDTTISAPAIPTKTSS